MKSSQWAFLPPPKNLHRTIEEILVHSIRHHTTPYKAAIQNFPLMEGWLPHGGCWEMSWQTEGDRRWLECCSNFSDRGWNIITLQCMVAQYKNFDDDRLPARAFKMERDGFLKERHNQILTVPFYIHKIHSKCSGYTTNRNNPLFCSQVYALRPDTWIFRWKNCGFNFCYFVSRK